MSLVLEFQRPEGMDSAYASLESASEDVILRGMPAHDFFESGLEGSLRTREWDREFDMMNSEEGISALSATLLQNGCMITPYTNKGVLFQRSLIVITDIFKGDANTAVAEDGAVMGDLVTRCATIEALKEYISADPQAEHRPPMNELKINTKLSGLYGLFFNKAPDKSTNDFLKAEMVVWQKHLREKYHLDLPVFEYKSLEGRLALIDTTKEGLKLPFSIVGPAFKQKQYRELLSRINPK